MTSISENRRPAVLSGSWYPADPQTLRTQISSYLVAAKKEYSGTTIQPSALVVPHAGLIYSGPTAAHAFGAVKHPPKRVILLGPAHRVSFQGISVGDYSHYECPLGDAPVDRKTVDTLLSDGLIGSLPEAHLEEHCLEMMLPFIMTLWGPIPILPLLVGHCRADEVHRVLDAVFAPGDLVCVSSDLSHFLTYDQAQAQDIRTLESIVHGRWKELDPRDACGCIPLAGLIQFAQERSLVGSILDYRNSGDTGGDRSRVVGYGALAYGRADSK